MLHSSQTVSAVTLSNDSEIAVIGNQAHPANPPELHIGDMLKEKRLSLGWSMEQASKKTAIPVAALRAIENTALNMFINDGAKLNRHLQIYANRLGLPLQPHAELVSNALSSIRPKEITTDLINFVRRSQ